MTEHQRPPLWIELHCEQCGLTYARLPVEPDATVVSDLELQLTNLRREHWAREHQVNWLACDGRHN
jgi:hypothetical protein